MHSHALMSARNCCCYIVTFALIIFMNVLFSLAINLIYIYEFVRILITICCQHMMLLLVVLSLHSLCWFYYCFI